MPKKLITFEEARIKAGIKTETEMARKLGLSKATYQLKESYDRSFKDNELVRFCEITKTDPSCLYIKGLNY